MNLKERITRIKKAIPKITQCVSDRDIDGWRFQNERGTLKLTYSLGLLYNTITYESKVSFLGITLAHEEFCVRSNDPLLPYDQWHIMHDLLISLIRTGTINEE